MFGYVKQLQLSRYLLCIPVVLSVFLPVSAIAQESRYKEIEAGLKSHYEAFSTFRLAYMNARQVTPPSGPTFTVEYINKMKDILQRMKSGQLTAQEKEEFKEISIEQTESTIQSIEPMLTPHVMYTLKVYAADGNLCRVDGYRTEGSPKHFYHIFDTINGYLITENDNGLNVRPSSGFTRQWVTPLYPVVFGSGIGRYLDYDLRVTSEDPISNSITLTYPGRGNELEARYTLLEKDSPNWKKCEIFFEGNLVKTFVCEQFTDYSGLLLPQSVKEYKGKQTDPYQEYTLDSVEMDNVAFEPEFFQVPYQNEMEVVNMQRRQQ